MSPSATILSFSATFCLKSEENDKKSIGSNKNRYADTRSNIVELNDSIRHNIDKQMYNFETFKKLKLLRKKKTRMNKINGISTAEIKDQPAAESPLE